MQVTSAILHALFWASMSLMTAWQLRTSLPDSHSVLSRAGVNLQGGVIYRKAGSHYGILDIYRPVRDSSGFGTLGRRKAVLAIHGGSWIGGSRTDYQLNPNNTVIRLAQYGLVVIAIDYRLATPVSPSWPFVIDDVREAVRWIRRHSSDLDIDPERIVALGQSSGAHLAALLGTLPDEQGPDGISSRVQGVISFYGPTDLTDLIGRRHLEHEPARALLANSTSPDPKADFAASPIRHVTEDDAPMLLLHGSDDAWVRPEQSSRMAQAIERVGVPNRLIMIDGARHGFEAKVNDLVERDLLPDILAFLESVWNL